MVRHAAERFITVVPEIEMPGHARAAIAAYPELGNSGEPVEVETTWGVFEQIFSPEDRTLAFLQDVLEEVLDIFPSPYIHIGGDEVPKEEWKHSPAAQARMRRWGCGTRRSCTSWFVRQMGAWLAGRGRRLVGWEEILPQGRRCGLAPGATVMAWQSPESAITAARQGHDAVIAPRDWTYLDYLQSDDPREPTGIGGLNTLENAYAFDPDAASAAARAGQAHPGRPGPAVDRIHARPQKRRIHGLAAAVGASPRRCGRPGRFPAGATSPTSNAACGKGTSSGWPCWTWRSGPWMGRCRPR